MKLKDISDLKKRLIELEINYVKSIWFTPLSQVPYNLSAKLSSNNNLIRIRLIDVANLDSRENNSLWAHLYLLGLYEQKMARIFRNQRDKNALISVSRHLILQYDKAVTEAENNFQAAETKKIMFNRTPYVDIDVIKPQLKRLNKAKEIIEELCQNIEKSEIYTEDERFYQKVYLNLLNRINALEKKEVNSIKEIREKEKEELILKVADKLVNKAISNKEYLGPQKIYYQQAEELLKYHKFKQHKEEAAKIHRFSRNQINLIQDNSFYEINENISLYQQLSDAWKRNEQEKAYKIIYSIYNNAVLNQDESLKELGASMLESFDIPQLIDKNTRTNLEEAKSFICRVGNGPLLDIINSSYKNNLLDEKSSLMEFSQDLASPKWKILREAISAYNYFGFENNGNRATISKVDSRYQEVPYYTPISKISFTGNIMRYRQFINLNPQTLLYQLAMKQQPYRQFYKEHRRETVSRVINKEAKYYLLDMSTSMKLDKYSRAIFRDALLIAELNKHILEAEENGYFNPLFFQFFSDKPFKVYKVESREEARTFIMDLMNYQRASGGTDITEAICTAFTNIRNAEKDDPDLYKATVVLVTDGDDRVDTEAVEAARKGFEDDDLEIVLHFISIVMENEDLKEMVLKQNAENKKAFYYHVSLEDIESCEKQSLANEIISEYPSHYLGNGIDQFNEKILQGIELLEKRVSEPKELDEINKDEIISNFNILFPDPHKKQSLKVADQLFNELEIKEVMKEISFKVNTVLGIIYELRSFSFGSYEQASENIELLEFSLRE